MAETLPLLPSSETGSNSQNLVAAEPQPNGAKRLECVPACRRFRSSIAHESWSKPHALQTLRESSHSWSILRRQSISTTLSDAARAKLLSVRGEPLLIADWEQVLMIHYEVDVAELQGIVPFELDLGDGRAFVSVVAFTMRGMRPYRGGQLSAWLVKPISTHEFLNVRTYVRRGDETGIYFMAEWLSNRLSVALGPIFFGLPYRHGRIRYRELNGSVHDASGAGDFSYRGKLAGPRDPVPCESGSLTEWLMERYTAFTCFNGVRRLFRGSHAPWRQATAQVSMTDQRLLENRWPFMREGSIVGANYSLGVRDVWMGRPHRITMTGFDAG